jgi:hypothetical protein
MAPARGKQRSASEGDPSDVEPPDAAGPEVDLFGDDESLRPIPELVRRALTLGLTGFFSTEEAVRRAFGDTVPKDWTDFLSETSDRTRSEFLERLSHEIGRVLDGVDVGAVLRTLLEGKTLEVKAQFRLTDEGGAGKTALSVSVPTEEKD